MHRKRAFFNSPPLPTQPLSLLGIAGLLLALTACGGKGDAPAANGAAGQKPQVQVGVVTATTGDVGVLTELPGRIEAVRTAQIRARSAGILQERTFREGSDVRAGQLLFKIDAAPDSGMNPFINAQGYSTVGMLSVTIGAVANLLLDPLFIFVFGFGVQGAAIATVISQTLSAVFVLYFLTRKSELKVRFVRKDEISECAGYAKNIVSLGTAGFIMQLTNSLVTICCNNVLSVTGGDIYISVMTIVSSVRQLVETPIYAMNEGTSPILSYNYGARRPKHVRKSIAVMSVIVLIYTAVTWSMIILIPEFLIRIFSSDTVLLKDAVIALKQYFAAFIFMDLQYIGQTVFKSLNKKKFAIFFSLLRKVFIVVPLTYLMPYALHMGTKGVFLAEPVSNVIGGSICFVTMLCTVLPELKKMEK